MANIKDIAEHLGISISTVSKSLNNATDVSDETKEKVLNAALELGYSPKRKKNNGISGFERKVCIFIENMDYTNNDQFGYDLIKGFRQAAELKHWQVDIVPAQLHALTSRSYDYDMFMLTNNYSGGFVISVSMHNDYNMQYSKTSVPTVLFDNYVVGNSKVGYVGSDATEGFSLAVEHLFKLGHKRIAFLNGAKNAFVSSQRTEAFRRAMKSFGLYADSNLIESGYYVPDCAKYHVPKFLDHGATAIICASDIIALGAISEVQKRGLKVPEDVSIIGFDDLPLCINVSPTITTIRQDRLNLGKSAVNLLDSLINNIPVSRTILRCELIPRESTTNLLK